MALVSYTFPAFLIVLLFVYYLVPGRIQWALLFFASILFYLSGGIAGFIWPVLTVLSTWFLAKKIGRMTQQAKTEINRQNLDKAQRKEWNKSVKKKQFRLLTAGLIFNFGILLGWKYGAAVLAAFTGTSGGGGGFLGLALPLGISYYTFQAMGYLIDVYRRKYEPEPNPAKLGLYICYFPQMTAGPISRFDRQKPELFAAHSFDQRNVSFGAERMLWGYFKKLVIADRMRLLVEPVIGAPEAYGGIYAFLGMLGYGIWLYADFSGGIDLVLGLSQMFGISLPENFDHPFSSQNVGEFWRRWHMSLMQWFREYIFFPVSTSKASRALSEKVQKKFGKKAGNRVPVYLATISVWLVTGIWHGTGGNYLLWGLANGAVILLSQELTKCYQEYRGRFPFTNRPWYRYFGRIRTFFLFCLLTSFQYGLLPRLFHSRQAGVPINGLSGGSFWPAGFNRLDGGILLAGLLLFAAASRMQAKGSVRERLERLPFVLRYCLVFGLFLIVLTAGVYGQGYDASQFIYNQF